MIRLLFFSFYEIDTKGLYGIAFLDFISRRMVNDDRSNEFFNSGLRGEERSEVSIPKSV